MVLLSTSCNSPARKHYRRSIPDCFRALTVVFLLIAIIPAGAAAAEYILNETSIGQFEDGISYTGTDDLVIEVRDDVAIRSTGSAGIASAAPLTLRSPSGKTLSIFVDNDSDLLAGITAPSVTVESGGLNITVRGENDAEKGNAFGIRAGSGNVTITGGTIFADVATAGHKNKGIYASRYVVISGGRIDLCQHGGSNTFGIDGGDVETESTDGGMLISGGTIIVDSTGGKNRNIGIDSKFGRVGISGDPVIFAAVDTSGARQNFTYNTGITTISGGRAVVFASEGGNFTLRQDAVLSRDVTFPAGSVFEIPAGRTLGIAEKTYLTRPLGTAFLFGNGFGTVEYARSTAGNDGSETYAGDEPTQKSPAPGAALVAGLGAVAFLHRRKNL